MKNKILKVFMSIFLIGIIMGSCTKDDAYLDHREMAPNSDFCGEYMVTYSDVDGVPYDDPSILLVYNSANDESKIWIDDNYNFWQYKVKANLSGSNFSVNKGFDEIWDDSTTITKGSFSNGNIYLEIEWASDPGTIYYCKGTKRTGFE